MYVTNVSSDGKYLVAGGRSNLLHLWCLDSRQLVRVLQMPALVRTVRQLHFLPDSFDGGASQVATPTRTAPVLKYDRSRNGSKELLQYSALWGVARAGFLSVLSFPADRLWACSVRME